MNNFCIIIFTTDLLSQEKFGSEEVRLAPLAPLPASMLQSTTKQFLFCSPEKMFRKSLLIDNFSGSGDPDSLFHLLPLPSFP